MTAISTTYSSIANSAIDPDSPITTGLMTALRDNTTFVYEWLGVTYAAGAVQNHNHDGVNSVLVPIGPNFLRNPSFESGEDGWTFTDYTGGSHAQETSNDMHGAASMSITSTVLANGGGYAVSNEYVAIAETDEISYRAWLKASTGNVSARIEIIWYDDAESQVSVTQVTDLTNTPTSATFYAGRATAPSTARYMRMRITGGVPAAGSATGTVYFDGLGFAPAVVRDHLKTTTASGSQGITGGVAFSYTLAGGTWSLWTASATLPSGSSGVGLGNGNTSAGVLGFTVTGTGGGTFYIDERYFQSSPPYDLGDGPVRKFVYVRVAPDGSITGTFVGDDPIWANHSPINIKQQFFSETQADGVSMAAAMRDAAIRERVLRGQAEIRQVQKPITAAMRQAVMTKWAAPWPSTMPRLVDGQVVEEQQTIVLLDPVSDFVGRLAEISQAAGAKEIVTMIEDGYINIGNTPKAGRSAIPGAMQVDCSFKNRGA